MVTSRLELMKAIASVRVNYRQDIYKYGINGSNCNDLKDTLVDIYHYGNRKETMEIMDELLVLNHITVTDKDSFSVDAFNTILMLIMNGINNIYGHIWNSNTSIPFGIFAVRALVDKLYRQLSIALPFVIRKVKYKSDNVKILIGFEDHMVKEFFHIKSDSEIVIDKLIADNMVDLL